MIAPGRLGLAGALPWDYGLIAGALAERKPRAIALIPDAEASEETKV